MKAQSARRPAVTPSTGGLSASKVSDKRGESPSDRRLASHPLIQSVHLPVSEPVDSNRLSEAWKRVYASGRESGYTRAQLILRRDYLAICGSIEARICSTLELIGLDSKDEAAVESLFQKAGKNAAVVARSAKAVISARSAIESGKAKLEQGDFRTALERLVEAGGMVGGIERDLGERSEDLLRGLFEAREAWRRDSSPGTCPKKFDVQCATKYGSAKIKRLYSKRLANLLSRFWKSSWAKRSRLLSRRSPGDFYDASRGSRRCRARASI
jgi:hypothetical protein